MNTSRRNKPQKFEKATLIKLAVDIHACSYTVVRQVDNTPMQPPQQFVPTDFPAWALEQRLVAERVVVCYESGPFGFTLARKMQALGIECLVMAAQQLDQRQKRVQTDRLDAQEIASRLDRYLSGNPWALAVVKIPTLEQELKRSEARQRQQLIKTRKQLEAQGRSLLMLYGDVLAQSSWWQEEPWKEGQKYWPAPVVEMLERWRQVLLEIQKQVESLTDKIEASLPEYLPKTMPQLPVGVGALSWVLLCREIVEWKRFDNRGQVGSFSGLVASECSSGQSRRQGHVTKVGNPRIRALLVEMVWRLLKFQPDYWVVKKWRPRMYVQPSRKASPSARKKAVVAMARLCMIDLWRLANGTATPQKLGLRVARPPEGPPMPERMQKLVVMGY